MILAGDIGGTKTVLALYSREDGVSAGSIHETRYESSRYDSVEAIIAEFLAATNAHPVAASFGVAGPVMGAITLSLIQNIISFADINTWWETLVKASIIVVALAAPGVINLIRRRRA